MNMGKRRRQVITVVLQNETKYASKTYRPFLEIYAIFTTRTLVCIDLGEKSPDNSTVFLLDIPSLGEL